MTNSTIIDKDQRALELLQAYQEGNASAFSDLYDMYIQLMLNYGCCLTSDVELVKDCIQDVFIRLLDKRQSPAVKRLSSYLVISLRNRLVDEFRKVSYNASVDLDCAAKRKSVVDVETDYLEEEKSLHQKNKVAYLMEALTPRQREALQLYYLDEKKYDEICQIMNMNYHSVRNLVHRGMLKLRAAAL